MPEFRRRRRSGGFDPGFGPASVYERRQADLFFRDLVGARRSRSAAALARPTPHVGSAGETADPPFTVDSGPEDDPTPTFIPEDLAKDMPGLEFVLASAADIKTASGAVRHAAGTVITVVKWDNGKVEIEAKIGGVNATVDKALIRPKISGYKATVTTPSRSWDVGIPLYAANVKPLQQAIAKGKAAGQDQTANYKQLNKHLIIETMLNRHDALLGRWTAHYDGLIGEKQRPEPWPPLAPGWVKSMMVQESTAGTAGKHLLEVNNFPPKTRFNVLQAIDSWGFQQFLMIEEMVPGLLKSKGLDKVVDDQRLLEQEWDRLKAKTARTTAEEERLKYLNRLKFDNVALLRSPTWSTFFFMYPDVDMKPKASSKAATGSPATTSTTTGSSGTSTTGSGGTPAKPSKYWDVVKNFLETGTPMRKHDYSFWIQTGVRWLFEKKKGVEKWSDAVRAYNGVGGRAEFYRAIVVTRARAAAAAAGIDEPIWARFNCDKRVAAKDGVFQLCPFEQVANPCEPRC